MSVLSNEAISRLPTFPVTSKPPGRGLKVHFDIAAKRFDIDHIRANGMLIGIYKWAYP